MTKDLLDIDADLADSIEYLKDSGNLITSIDEAHGLLLEALRYAGFNETVRAYSELLSWQASKDP